VSAARREFAAEDHITRAARVLLESTSFVDKVVRANLPAARARVVSAELSRKRTYVKSAILFGVGQTSTLKSDSRMDTIPFVQGQVAFELGR